MTGETVMANFWRDDMFLRSIVLIFLSKIFWLTKINVMFIYNEIDSNVNGNLKIRSTGTSNSTGSEEKIIIVWIVCTFQRKRIKIVICVPRSSMMTKTP
jgi:NurA-like 5'-3' nuclease